MAHWLDVGAETRDADRRPASGARTRSTSTYPACQAVKAAVEQGADAAYRYLRRVREGLMLERKKLDHPRRWSARRARPGSTSSASGSIWARTRSPRRSPRTSTRSETRRRRRRAAGKVRATERHERVSFPSALFVGDGRVPPRRLGLAAVRRLPGGRDRRRRGGRRRTAARAARGGRAIRPLRDARARGADRKAAAGARGRALGPCPRLEAAAGRGLGRDASGSCVA